MSSRAVLDKSLFLDDVHTHGVHFFLDMALHTFHTFSQISENEVRDNGPRVLSDAAKRCSGLDPVLKNEAYANIRMRNKYVFEAVRQAMESGNADKLCLMKMLRSPPAPLYKPFSHIISQEEATVDSWRSDFRGSAATTLLATIKGYINVKDEVCALCASIVNSSGMGKSRLVSQLALTVIILQICLRFGSNGFPAPDVELRDWLLHRAYSWPPATVSTALLHSLFIVLMDRLVKVVNDTEYAGRSPLDLSEDEAMARITVLAEKFTTEMSQNQTFHSHNEYHNTFFREVIAKADVILKAYQEEMEIRRNEDSPVMCTVDGDNMLTAVQRLTDFLGYSQIKSPPPIILSFDEVHELTQQQPGGWSIYSEIHRILCHLKDYHVFVLFISTAGKFHPFTPNTVPDSSSRIMKIPLRTLPPITELSFDELALPVQEDKTRLEEVTTDSFMAHLGRPLFGSRYDHGDKSVRDDIVNFALNKLLCGVPIPSKETDITSDHDDAALAAIAVRCPIEFKAEAMKDQDTELRQVESHMRVVVAATSDQFVTMAGSEPLLAEAAATIQPDHGYAFHLDRLMSISAVHAGDRGEYPVLLQMLAARDKAARISGRTIPVLDFMEALLPVEHHEHLRSSLPSVCLNLGDGRPFEDAFKKARLTFNHFIKTEEYSMLNVDYLWLYLARGAAIVCATNRPGIDILIPFSFFDSVLGRRNVSAILVQVKNDPCYGVSISRKLLDTIDPLRLKVFKKGQPSLPVIRMVFALAASASGVSFGRLNSAPSRSFGKYTAYDIWCAGLSPRTFGPMEEAEVPYYQSLLRRSQSTADIYDLWDDWRSLNDPTIKAQRIELRRKMNPATSTLPEHWKWCQQELTVTGVEDEYVSDDEDESEKNSMALGA